MNHGKANEMLAHRVRERDTTSQTITKRKLKYILQARRLQYPTGVLKNVVKEDNKACQNNVRAEEEQITVARTKQDEEEDSFTGIKPAGRENNGTRKKTRRKRINKTSKQDNKGHYCRALSRSLH